MIVGLTGWGGFLATKLRECKDVTWVERTEDIDCLVIMGSPTFTHAELSQHDAHVVHQYVRETIRMIDRFDGHIVFASTTGVDDIQLCHKGSTAYNLGKLYLENYVLNHSDKYSILRIGTIVSGKQSDIEMMKPDRIQQRILQKNFENIPYDDVYLDVDVFVKQTMDVIQNCKTGIIEYPLTNLSLPKLINLGK